MTSLRTELARLRLALAPEIAARNAPEPTPCLAYPGGFGPDLPTKGP